MKHQFTVNFQEHGNNRWRVEGKIAGRRIRAFFPTRELAEEHARIRNIELRNAGAELANISSELRAEAKACQQRLDPLAVSLTEAVNFYLAHHDVRSRSVSVSDACASVRREWTRRLENREISEKYHKAMGKACAKLISFFGSRMICDITTTDLRDELTALSVATSTRNHYRTHFGVIFAFARDNRWVKENPVAELKSWTDRSDKTPEIVTVAQAAKLLECATDPRLVPVFAIGLFAGLRPAEIRRLDWSEIRWDKAQIRVTSAKSKTAQPRWVKMTPALMEWLAPYRKASGPVNPLSESNQYKLIAETVKAAGLSHWPQDGLRHSFGSYHMALHQNAPLTAAQMGHMTTKMVHAHYDNHMVMQDEAEAYFAIRSLNAPEKIVAMAAGNV
jgi:integrase